MLRFNTLLCPNSMLRWRAQGFGVQEARIGIASLPLNSYVSWCKLLNFSEFKFPQL